MLARVHGWARDRAGRVATAAGTAVLAGGLATDTVTAPGVLAAVTTAGLGLATNIKLLRAPSAVKTTAIAVYASPHAAHALILAGERLAPDSGVSLLVQASAIALWTGATWYIRPGRLARRLADEAVLQEITEAVKNAESEAVTDVAVPDQPADASPAARWWREEIAAAGGIAPGTVLLDHQRLSDECVAIVFGSAQRGMPVPDLSTPRLSAHLDVPEDLIETGPVPGRGAGVRLLVIGPRPAPAGGAAGDEEVWEQIAASAMPGIELIEVNEYELRKELT